MFIELHQLQNFAPSCLNRDDTNSPKDCVFGGVRRARLSSQCLKRAIREHARANGDEGLEFGVRTKRLHAKLVERLQEGGKNDEEAAEAATKAIEMLGLSTKDNKKGEKLTGYLLFLGEGEVQTLVEAVLAHWDTLAGGKKKAPKEMKDAFDAVLDGRKAADVALFGRMLADLPQKNVDAACQVAHAISTHKVDMEMDFFTAVDDRAPDDTSGADMMGTVEFNSACFYRYAIIDWEQLVANLDGDTGLARATVEAFLRGASEALPTGKQNTFAAHNPPSLQFAVVREQGAPWSLANAFEKAVWGNGQGVVKGSIGALNGYYARLKKMYGGTEKAAVHCSLEDETCEVLGTAAETYDDFVAAVMAALPEA